MEPQFKECLSGLFRESECVGLLLPVLCSITETLELQTAIVQADNRSLTRTFLKYQPGTSWKFPERQWQQVAQAFQTHCNLLQISVLVGSKNSTWSWATATLHPPSLRLSPRELCSKWALLTNPLSGAMKHEKGPFCQAERLLIPLAMQAVGWLVVLEGLWYNV